MTPVAVTASGLPGCPQALQLRAVVYACGFPWFKRALLREFTARQDIVFCDGNALVPPGSDLLLWGSRPVPEAIASQAQSGIRIVRVEDGFIRSVGLGADLARPMSWVMDASGIYYDATRPSDLETLLSTADFSESLVGRAQLLRNRLVAAGISKYNLAGSKWQRPDNGRRVVLVIGQVQSDASISSGAVDIRTNLGLLEAVRHSRPDAWIVYKPHPDVVAGLRQGGLGAASAGQWADEVVAHGSPAQIIASVDEVHVMTSLAGFEALLRHKPVHCYGQPFYAGWGLTHDRHPHARRSRALTLDQLVAGALLLYPAYVSRRTRKRCTAEEALLELLAWRDKTRANLPWWRRLLRPLLARP